MSTSTLEDRKVSPEDIQMVQNLIEECLAHYMTKKQVMDILYQQQNIEPTFTKLVWQKLVEQNEEFFKAYHLRLTVKEQIVEFNNLLGRQAALMNQMHPNNAAFRPVSNVSHMPAMRHNASYYASDIDIVPKTANMQHSVPTVLPSGFNNCGPSIHSGMQRAHDLSAHFRSIDVPLNMLLAHNSNVAIKPEPGYLGNSRFVDQAGGNVMEAHPIIERAFISSFGSMDSNSHQLNGALLDDTSSFEHFRQISQNISLPGLATDFTNSTDTLRFSRSAFLLPDRDNLLDSHGYTVEDQGENKKLDNISGNIGYQNFGRDS